MLEFVIFLRPLRGAAPPTRDTVSEHCRRLAELGREGKLIAGGPFGDAAGGGMIVARFESLEAARTFAEGDPFVTSGFETFELRPWAWSRPENGHLGVLDPAPGTFPGFLDALALRPTTRRFAERPVEEVLVRAVLEAALAAPSEFNLQPWRPVVCHVETDRRRLRTCCYDQPQVDACRVAVVCAVDPAAFHEEAPRAVDELIATGHWPAEQRQAQLDFVRAYYDGPQKVRDSAVRNATIFGHQLLLAGFSQGLAGFWLGGFDEAAVKREFAMPERSVIAGVVGLGWPERHEPPRPRLADGAVVGWGALVRQRGVKTVEFASSAYRTRDGRGGMVAIAVPARAPALMRWLLPLLVLVPMPGCASVVTQYGALTGDEELAGPSDQTLRPVYGGVRLDLSLLQDASWKNPGPCVAHPLPVILDLPFSFALDTFLLPVTAIEAIHFHYSDRPASGGSRSN